MNSNNSSISRGFFLESHFKLIMKLITTTDTDKNEKSYALPKFTYLLELNEIYNRRMIFGATNLTDKYFCF